MSNLQLRTISAIILGSAVLWLTWLGDLPFRLLAVAIGVGVFYEWVTITAAKQTPLSKLFGWLSLALVMALLVWGEGALIILAVLFGAAVLLYVVSNKTGGFWPVVGLLYAGFPPIALAFLRNDDADGLVAIVFLFAVVWSTDIFAYFNGRALGGPKLAPRISPNKTWSGALGGAAAAVAAGIAVAAVAGPPGSWTVPLIALLLSIASQCGDIGESWVKRVFGVKDSGRIIPGHGGVMDRVDGLVIAASLLYLLGVILAGPDTPSDMFLAI